MQLAVLIAVIFSSSFIDAGEVLMLCVVVGFIGLLHTAEIHPSCLPAINLSIPVRTPDSIRSAFFVAQTVDNKPFYLVVLL